MTTPIWEWNIFGYLKTVFTIALVLGGVIALPGLALGAEKVDAGEYGVVTEDGEVVRTVGPGIHYTIPFVQDMERMPQRYEMSDTVPAFTRDGETIEVTYRVTYQIPPDEVTNVYQKSGGNVGRLAEIHIRPCAQAGVRDVASAQSVNALYDNISMLQTNVSTCASEGFTVQVQNVRFTGVTQTIQENGTQTATGS